ncbi:hypothetical protein DSLASN_02970 [Desulfoluna limicola]|uniref:Glycosyl transferase family 1 domain-containing protein n=2 Tax=Desulfoluna limicola TaxID=2810562 RepID=A0ABM7PBU6_9BACT|nr:hypothetical protein DSLASN_02970 [Desulfoluna limicola]
MAKCLVQLGCSQQKVQVHHLGVEVDKISYRPRRWQPETPLRILISGAFKEKKGIPYALEAIGRLQHEMQLEITIIGDATSEHQTQVEKEKILKTIKDNDLTQKIRMLGFQPHTILMEESLKHHIFISPSITAIDGDTEGGAPVSIIEMVASGIPVVSTMHCDIPEVINYGMKDWLVAERDVQSIIDKIKWLSNNYENWSEWLDIGRKHIEKQYHSHSQGVKLQKCYSDLLSEAIPLPYQRYRHH